MKVYGHPGSIYTRMVLATLAEKGHEAEFVLVDLPTGAHKLPEHLARHPFGVVPAFEDNDGFSLYESQAIIRYLDRKLEGPSLVPSQPRACAVMEQSISVGLNYFAPNAFKVIWEKFLKQFMGGGVVDEAVVMAGRQGMEKVFALIDPTLARQPFLAGDAVSLADVTWMPFMAYLFPAGEEDTVARYKNVAAWWERTSSRPAWRKVTGE
ncbi:glutathione S-transferase [Myxococcus stipitatus DSM 14675]|uniref:glutathione transferase n=1 Tax=Myxococcus stipitatus (strain DSM 14675 / JCM 12634 / Mx s8) TaxID=1278073 RepID=L7U3L8_MYXSD|nr:glutathione S-transferase family protein [Myxococcus stipitatus]AGC42793.1 glutathione S-transferase [Myxococcus stipitatus DSM 14675]